MLKFRRYEGNVCGILVFKLAITVVYMERACGVTVAVN